MNVLITGGTGLVGKEISQILLQKGHTVSFLSRSPKTIPHIKVYHWDIEKQEIDVEAIQKADHIIHLAGAGVADKTWTDSYKKEILDSRILSTQLLYKTLKENKNTVKSFISASAIGIYGFDTGNTLLAEDSLQGNDFLADVTKQWEAEVQKIQDFGIRTNILRIGIVLSNKGGALPKMMQPIKFWAGAPLGSGQQYLSWIHIRDLANMFLYGIENPHIQGIYNAVASKPISNKVFTENLAKVMQKPLFLPNVPSFVLKAMLGEMGVMILGGNNVSNSKIIESGFQFEFDDIEKALSDLVQS
ncbi:MAG: TIGR01777 family oxidoreductase [Thermonemataceae bacterium]|nr:TIGR01777 family oxidoreductase [Thermonemataceae bacterium]